MGCCRVCLFLEARRLVVMHPGYRVPGKLNRRGGVEDFMHPERVEEGEKLSQVGHGKKR